MNILLRHSRALAFIALAAFTGAVVPALHAHEHESTPAEDVAAIKKVVAAYKEGMEKLDVADAARLFTKDSQVFESGGVEGTFDHYLEHHIGPELGEFKEFTYRDYKLDVRLDPPFALATESYIYRLVVKADGKVHEKRGVATSVLKKIDGHWKFIQTHTSSRNLPNK